MNSFFDSHTNTFHIYNKYHLGDHVFNIIFFNKILPHLKKNNMKIEYYMEESYRGQVEEFILDRDIIQIKRMEQRGLEAWINNRDIVLHYELQTKIGFDTYYVYYYNRLLKLMNIPMILLDLKYEDNELLLRKNRILGGFPHFRNLEILIINSEPMSGQYRYNRNDWNQFILYLSQKYKIITTLKIPNIPCTMDYKLTIKDIASISTYMKYIISINTGPFVGCYNKYTLENVEKIYMFVDNLFYDHPKIETYKDIEDIYLYL